MKRGINRTRRSAILGELAKLSRNGWAGARPEDYQPLEQELARLDQRAAIRDGNDWPSPRAGDQ